MIMQNFVAFLCALIHQKKTKKIPIKLTVQQYKTGNNCRFFSATGYKYMDDDFSDNEKNSQVSIVSDMSVNSNTSKLEEKLDDAETRVNNYHIKGKDIRKEMSETNKDMNEFIDSKYRGLSPDKLREYDQQISLKEGAIHDREQDLKKTNTASITSKIRYALLSNKVMAEKKSLSSFRSKFLEDNLDNLTDRDKNFMDINKEAQENHFRDLTTNGENLSKLRIIINKLKVENKKRSKISSTETNPEVVNPNSDGVNTKGKSSSSYSWDPFEPKNFESGSSPYSPNKGEGSQSHQPNSSHQSNRSLVEDYADPNQEMPDYFGSGDD